MIAVVVVSCFSNTRSCSSEMLDKVVDAVLCYTRKQENEGRWIFFLLQSLCPQHLYLCEYTILQTVGYMSKKKAVIRIWVWNFDWFIIQRKCSTICLCSIMHHSQLLLNKGYPPVSLALFCLLGAGSPSMIQLHVASGSLFRFTSITFLFPLCTRVYSLSNHPYDYVK